MGSKTDCRDSRTADNAFVYDNHVAVAQSLTRVVRTQSNHAQNESRGYAFVPPRTGAEAPRSAAQGEKGSQAAQLIVEKGTKGLHPGGWRGWLPWPTLSTGGQPKTWLIPRRHSRVHGFGCGRVTPYHGLMS